MRDRLYTEGEIKSLLQRSNKVLVRGLLNMYFINQTASERAGHSTNIRNYKGFNMIDARLFQPYINKVLAGNYLNAEELQFIRVRMLKYSKQLMNLANKKLLNKLQGSVFDGTMGAK